LEYGRWEARLKSVPKLYCSINRDLFAAGQRGGLKVPRGKGRVGKKKKEAGHYSGLFKNNTL
jgi:hypothetical protein